MDELKATGELKLDIAGEEIVLLESDLLIDTAQMEGYVSESDNDITVVLDTNLTPELIEEGYVREIISKVQTMRKEAGFEVTYPYAGYDTAYCAKLDNGDGPSVALLAEYDALPEIGHGCGHNLHGSLSVLSGLALMDLKDNLPLLRHIQAPGL